MDHSKEKPNVLAVYKTVKVAASATNARTATNSSTVRSVKEELCTGKLATKSRKQRDTSIVGMENFKMEYNHSKTNRIGRRKALADVTNVMHGSSRSIATGGSNLARNSLSDVTNVMRGSSKTIVNNASKPALAVRPRISLPIPRASLVGIMKDGLSNENKRNDSKRVGSNSVKFNSVNQIIRSTKSGTTDFRSNATSKDALKPSNSKSKKVEVSIKTRKSNSFSGNNAVTCQVNITSRATGVMRKEKNYAAATLSSQNFAIPAGKRGHSRNGLKTSRPKCSSVSLAVTQHKKNKEEGKSKAAEDKTIRQDGNSICVNQSKTKAARRRSFTALLMERSLIPGQRIFSDSPVKHPNLYDTENELEVADYVDDIYCYYWVTEAETQTLHNYMAIQTEITPTMRAVLINWLIEVTSEPQYSLFPAESNDPCFSQAHFKFDLMHETLFLMTALLDQYLSQEPIQRKELQLVGITSLLLASKFEDYWHPKIKDLISISAESYSHKDVLRMESRFLKALKFRVNVPTIYVFMLRFLKAAKADLLLERLSFFLVELSLVEYAALQYTPSVVCAAAVYTARSTLRLDPPWTPLLEKYSRYRVSHIRSCAEMILSFHQSAKTSSFDVAYRKYLRPEMGSVAAIAPLDKLL